ncbi:MAG: glycosyltransferase family 2 protein [Bacteroidales bacterium]|nr:glycosyltransferase family 2 protein [Bacteroidales bacterium]
MHTAIVILNWNGKAFLKAFLSPLLDSIASTPEAEVIIADNGSTDGSIDFLQAHYPQLRLILFEQNLGYTGGYNQALAQIKADYYVLLNSDVQVDSNWLEPLISFMELNPQAGICMPKIRSLNQPDYFEYAGACGGFIDRWGYPFCRGRILSHIEHDHGQYDTPIEIFWASGTCLMIRAALFHELGGFDERFFAHMEEIDLCWRAKLRGQQVWVVPQSLVFHVGGGTLSNDSPKKLYLNYRNNLWMLHKNLPKGKRFVTLTFRILLDYLSAFVYLIRCKPTLFSAVFRAHRHFWKGRGQVSPQARGTVGHIWGKSIVWRFFLKRKKLTFDKITFPLQ